MRRTELLPTDEAVVDIVTGLLFPGRWNFARPYGAEILRRVVRKNSVRYRKDVLRSRVAGEC